MRHELIAFLRARLDEAERLAREAAEAAWSPDWYYDDFVHEIRDHGNGNELAHIPWAGVGAHIEHWDPARVLAEVEAKQQLLTIYADVAASDLPDEPFEYAYGWANGLGRAVRLAVLPYADHPDYREEWRP
ncbi:DUF6221 family protein [Streptomyces sp. CAU 1734]|uniref:DUF6221 family protein n=1 Tax=Streptomyces sp. CAU 1734 TaxID=3140360 RepID=UPI003260CFF0